MAWMKGIGVVLLSVLLGACTSKASEEHTIRVGTIAGPETRLMEVAKNVAWRRFGLDIKIVEFNDYTMPNTALYDGSIDANMFQHQPYLDETNAARHYQLINLGKTFIYPMGIYSKKIKQLNDLPQNAVVAIPNDPSNSARALLLLEKAKLIGLKSSVKTEATLSDIISNPKEIQIKELDAAQLPRVLTDVDLAVINTNYAIPAGLIPKRDALAMENTDSLYANIIAIRAADKNNPKLAQLVLALHSENVKETAQKLFGGQAIAAW